MSLQFAEFNSKIGAEHSRQYARNAAESAKTVPMERAHELKCEIREALRDLGLESVYAKGVADKTLDALEELEALAVTESAKEGS
jgi:chemotaxis regulatin CheY-phosphate phosphatase CheZ